MAKRGVNDQYGNFSEADANALEWEFVGLNIASAHVGSMDNPAGHSEDRGLGTDASTSDAGAPESFAAKKGGGATSSGGTTSGGTTSGSSTGSTTLGQGATTLTLHDVTTTWRPLAPAIGDTALPTDPYFANWQWSLTNPTTGINVPKAWQNYTGAGIKIGIVDDGIDYNHPDLSPNYLSNLDYDATNGGSDAYGTSSDSHGTTVAGVLAAAHDGSGIAGIAYHAGIAGFRISYSTGGPSQIADAFNHLATNGMDVANASWGYSAAYQDNFFSSSFGSSKSAILNDAANGRGGLGIDMVFAAGNGRATGDNVNYHNYQNDPYVITVAATDINGRITTFSTPGAALLVSAPGLGTYTDDRLGSAGYSTDDYTSAAGTSYAAPTVAGVIALMLQANPTLGYRDVMDILAYSAKNSDPTNTGWQTNGAHDWNGGGLHFSNDYGFGLVDATAAVRLAESWQKQSTYANMSTESAGHTDNAAIPDGSGSLQSQITFASSLEVEKMVIDLNITHAHVSDLAVTLTSSSGTTAVLASHPTGGTGSGIVFETTANSFWGEDAKGTWTLTVTDSVSGNVGTLNSWTLTALGDAPNTPTTYVYTDEFATAAGASRQVLNDASGSATINTAAVSTGSYLDLNRGATDTIAGKALQIGASTIIKNAWAGDGNDTIIANDFGDTIQGGRGNDTIVAGHGADVLYGGSGSDTFMFKFLTTAGAVIRDFTAGQDIIDLNQILTSAGYVGTNPVTDGWLNLLSDGHGGTNVVVDAHNGQTPVTVVDVTGVASNQLHSGTPWTLVA
ncbi:MULTISPECIES: S8 family serine peptidase [unclassified Bradyrhizobium]|uniref:S8 family serine peptidase n=1 Tax=unclassified Bradyrhizobium TaxID=2631580 RepID=UPI00188C611E|nr:MULTISPECIES: S8 family serine peptidase [unclassified Bradyrhizobium]MDN4988493.1 S8 family serine peptidase [Bradyrhizobium sp. WYCCWR 13022]